MMYVSFYVNFFQDLPKIVLLSGLDSRDVEMRRCRTAGRVDDRASDSLPTRPKGNGSLSGRARERKLLVGKGER